MQTYISDVSDTYLCTKCIFSSAQNSIRDFPYTSIHSLTNLNTVSSFHLLLYVIVFFSKARFKEEQRELEEH